MASGFTSYFKPSLPSWSCNDKEWTTLREGRLYTFFSQLNFRATQKFGGGRDKQEYRFPSKKLLSPSLVHATVGTDRLTGFFRCQKPLRKGFFVLPLLSPRTEGKDCVAAEANDPLAF